MGLAIAFALGLGLVALYARHIRGVEAEFHDELAKRFSVYSSSFADSASIPIRCTCDGGETRPEIRVDSVPEGTRSMVLIMHDADAPLPWLKLFFFVHWAAVDLPPGFTLPEANPDAILPVGMALENGMGKSVYIGPCPPIPMGRHAYVFRVYALTVDRLAVPTDIGYVDLLAAMKGKVLGYGERVGYYAK